MKKIDASYWAVWLATWHSLCIKDRCTNMPSQAIRSSSNFRLLNFPFKFHQYLHLEGLRSPWALIGVLTSFGHSCSTVDFPSSRLLFVTQTNPSLKLYRFWWWLNECFCLGPIPLLAMGSSVLWLFVATVWQIPRHFISLRPRRRVIRVGRTYHSLSLYNSYPPFLRLSSIQHPASINH